MTRLVIVIELGNAAMGSVEDAVEAIARVGSQLAEGRTTGAISDLNGNAVGHFEIGDLKIQVSA